MQIELRPHVGKSMASGRPVDLKQDMIFLDGEHVGYVGRQPDAPINLIRAEFLDEQVAAIRAAVQAKYGGQAQQVAIPPQLPDEAMDAGDVDDE